MFKKLIMILLLLISFLWIGCSESKFEPQRNEDEIIRNGWSAYKGGNYQSAVTNFEELIRMDYQRFAGYEGAGWAYLALGELDEASVKFRLADNIMQNQPTIWAGRAMLHHSRNEYDLAVYYAQKVLHDNTQYFWDPLNDFTVNSDGIRVFTSVANTFDLYLIIAESYYMSGNYERSYDALQKLVDMYDNEVLLYDVSIKDIYDSNYADLDVNTVEGQRNLFSFISDLGDLTEEFKYFYTRTQQITIIIQ